jgi:hypothetical protein
MSTCCSHMFHAFQMYVAYITFKCCKSRSSVAYIALAILVCFKCMFHMFQLFQTYVTSVLSGYCICCSGYTCMLQVYVPNFSPVSDLCYKCFIWMLHTLQYYTCFRHILRASIQNILSDVCCKCIYLEVVVSIHICCKCMFINVSSVSDYVAILAGIDACKCSPCGHSGPHSAAREAVVWRVNRHVARSPIACASTGMWYATACVCARRAGATVACSMWGQVCRHNSCRQGRRRSISS